MLGTMVSKIFMMIALSSLFASSFVNTIAIDLSNGGLTAEEFLANPGRRDLYNVGRDVNKRTPDNCQASEKWYYEPVGDGDPHQNYIITQIGGTFVACGHIEVTKTYSHETSWEVGLNGGLEKGPWSFTPLSFAVGESDTQSLEYTVECGENVEAICLLHYAAVTAVVVDFYHEAIGFNCIQTGKEHKGRGVVYLPNANSLGSFMRRGANFAGDLKQCVGNVDRTVNFFCGPAGGPDWHIGKALGPGTGDFLNGRSPEMCPTPPEIFNFSA